MYLPFMVMNNPYGLLMCISMGSYERSPVRH